MWTGKISIWKRLQVECKIKILFRYRRKDKTAQWENTLKFYYHFD